MAGLDAPGDLGYAPSVVVRDGAAACQRHRLETTGGIFPGGKELMQSQKAPKGGQGAAADETVPLPGAGARGPEDGLRRLEVRSAAAAAARNSASTAARPRSTAGRAKRRSSPSPSKAAWSAAPAARAAAPTATSRCATPGAVSASSTATAKAQRITLLVAGNSTPV